jgi:hypothetical protein
VVRALGQPARSRKTDPANSMWQRHQLPSTRSLTAFYFISSANPSSHFT